MKKISITAAGAASALLPMVALAQTGGVQADYVNSLLKFVYNFANAAIPVIITLAVLFFLWGLVTFILSSDDPEARDKAKSRMVWGVIIIFVMVSLWGLVNVLGHFFNLSNTAQNAPAIPTYTSIP